MIIAIYVQFPYQNKTTFEQIFGIQLPDNANVQRYFEQILDAMERKDSELAGLLMSQAYEDNDAYMMQTMKKAAWKG